MIKFDNESTPRSVKEIAVINPFSDKIKIMKCESKLGISAGPFVRISGRQFIINENLDFCLIPPKDCHIICMANKYIFVSVGGTSSGRNQINYHDMRTGNIVHTSKDTYFQYWNGNTAIEVFDPTPSSTINPTQRRGIFQSREFKFVKK